MATRRLVVVLGLLLAGSARAGGPEPSKTIGAEQADTLGKAALPGVVAAVRRGMQIEVVEPRPVRWRHAYAEATEKHASQVRLGPNGELVDYVAGLPFPSVTADDPEAGVKIMWNQAMGPWRPDDMQSQTVEWQYPGTRPLAEAIVFDSGLSPDIFTIKALETAYH